MLSTLHWQAWYEFWANRTRLPELDEETVKVQPLPIDCFSNGLFEAGTCIDESDVARDVN